MKSTESISDLRCKKFDIDSGQNRKSEQVKRGDCKKLNKIIKKVQQLSLGDSDSMPNCLLGENFHPLVLTSWSDV